MSDGIIKPPTSNNILNPLLNYVGTRIRVECKGSCLKQDKSSFNHRRIVNIYIVIVCTPLGDGGWGVVATFQNVYIGGT